LTDEPVGQPTVRPDLDFLCVVNLLAWRRNEITTFRFRQLAHQPRDHILATLCVRELERSYTSFGLGESRNYGRLYWHTATMHRQMESVPRIESGHWAEHTEVDYTSVLRKDEHTGLHRHVRHVAAAAACFVELVGDDAINLLGLADLLRRVRSSRQVVVSTHDQRLADLLTRQLRPTGQDRTLLVELDDWSRSGPVIQESEVEADFAPLKLAAIA
jgi:hypothetical protein